MMMYTVDNTTATSATLSNLQCNTEYTILVYYFQSEQVFREGFLFQQEVYTLVGRETITNYLENIMQTS